MPGRPHHSDAWHRCVDRVGERGDVDSPEAVCTETVGKDAPGLGQVHINRPLGRRRKLLVKVLKCACAEARGQLDPHEVREQRILDQVQSLLHQLGSLHKQYGQGRRRERPPAQFQGPRIPGEGTIMKLSRTEQRAAKLVIRAAKSLVRTSR